MIYDTLKLSKALRVSFTPEQSDTLAQAFSASTEDNVATKLDIAQIKTEIAQLRTELKTDIAAIRGESAAVRGEIAAIRGEIAAVRAELKNDIANLKVDMVRWIVSAIAFNPLGTIGIMIALVRSVGR